LFSQVVLLATARAFALFGGYLRQMQRSIAFTFERFVVMDRLGSNHDENFLVCHGTRGSP